MSNQKEISKILKELSPDELDVLVRKAQLQKKLKQDPYMSENRKRLLEAHKGYWKDDGGKKKEKYEFVRKSKIKGGKQEVVIKAVSFIEDFIDIQPNPANVRFLLRKKLVSKVD
jgi:hypothetical protein